MAGHARLMARHRGNKAALPVKLCERCGRPMVWRHRWRHNWQAVKVCSDACRRRKPAS